MSGSSDGNWWFGKADELLTHGVGSHLVSMAFTAAVIAVIHRTGHLKTLWQLAHGGFNGDEITLQRTDYRPSGVDIPDTDRKYRDQHIRIIDQISENKIFKRSIAKVLVSAMKKAEKEAKKEGASPLIYAHLPAILGEKVWEGLLPEMKRQSTVSFSDLFNDPKTVGTMVYDDAKPAPENYILPLPVVEKGFQDRLTKKWLSIQVRDGDFLPLPDMEDTRFSVGMEGFKRKFEPGEHQKDADRHRLLQKVYEELRKPENSWMLGFAVDVDEAELDRKPGKMG